MTADNGGVIQVVMTPALRQAFEAWLARSGHYIAAPAPLQRDDDLPTYIVMSRDAL
jgi:hypothetical protein